MDLLPNARAIAALVLATSAAAAGGSAATHSGLPVLGRLEAGLWQFRSLEGGRTVGAICLGDRGLLAQLRHPRLACRRTVVAASRDSVEVHYQCPAAFGQTTIRVETSRLARVESQGVDDGIPFGFRAEARRVGPCR